MAWIDTKTLNKMQDDIISLKDENAELKKFTEQQTLTNKQIFDNDIALKKMIDELSDKSKKTAYFG